MAQKEINQSFEKLKNDIKGELHTDTISRILYSTDASAYQEMPLAVVVPKNADDIKKVIQFAENQKVSVIPRAAGTSLAGQVVGAGIVMDISKYLTSIIELNKDEKWIVVEPGVNLDELNIYLKPQGLFFAPETSTSNRCRIGGMMGNNSCGNHSVIYGSTREHILEVKAILSDASEVIFKPLSNEEFEKKRLGNSLENKIYQNINEILSNPENQLEIRNEFPDPTNPRKNTGYALDVLLDCEPFTKDGPKFNFCKLLTGSEGTLAFATEIKLNLLPLPPKEKAVICAHFNSLDDALRANLIALKYKPGAVELMDDVIMDCTKGNIVQQRNRFFIKGEPKAMLMIEFARETRKEIDDIAMAMEAEMKAAGFGYHFPIVTGADITKVWELRKAGLGLLANVPGDRRSTTVIEDTSIKVEVLPDYISDIKELLVKYNQPCVYYGHVGSGELHLRPMMNLKDPQEVELFRTIGFEVAKLVKKYKGSLSGEHGDGRLRGEFVPLMVGEKNYQLLKEIKKAWDPGNILNPGKIVNTPPMTANLRLQTGKQNQEPKTFFDFSKTMGIVRAAEDCTGSADCRKSDLFGGTMCPSFMATRNEKDSTRARANILRQFLNNSTNHNPFNHKEIYEVMDLCLSCKACKSECPSSVDMTKLKAEFLQHYYDENGTPFRSWMIANIAKINSLASIIPGLYNIVVNNKIFSRLIYNMLGFSTKRKLPLLNKITLKKWIKGYKSLNSPNKTVYLFNDEFTNFNDTEIGIKAILLLTKLGYNVIIPKHLESGRTYLSKGLVRAAQKIAIKNVTMLHNLVSSDKPLIGIEPSAILTFRDEYPELVGLELKQKAEQLAKNTFTIDEFIANEIDKGLISKDFFTKQNLKIKYHGHCQQKAITSTIPTNKILSYPENYSVEEIPSGCCGMAGSFGYEKEHYEISLQIGELKLFPAIRNSGDDVTISASGTSCRCQIKDGTGRPAKHPIEILYEALIK